MKSWISKTAATKMLHATGRLTEEAARAFVEGLPQEEVGKRSKVHRLTVEKEIARLTAPPRQVVEIGKPISAAHRAKAIEYAVWTRLEERMQENAK